MNRFSSHVNKIRPTLNKKILLHLYCIPYVDFFQDFIRRKRHNLGILYSFVPKLCRLHMFILFCTEDTVTSIA